MHSCVTRCLLLLAVIVTAGGCLAPQGKFDRIASRLETGGTVYSVTDFSAVRKSATQWDQEFTQAVLDDQDVSLTNRREFFRRRALGMMVWNLLTLDTVEGWGASSVPRRDVADDDPVPVRNTLFFAMPTKNERGINGLFGKENGKFRETLAALPENTGLVLWGDLRPSFLIRSLKECSSGMKNFSGLMEFLTTIPLAGCDGVWLFAASPLPQATMESFDGWRLKLTLPDAGGKLFAALSRMVDAKSVTPGRLISPPMAPGFAPVLLLRNETLTVYNTSEAEQYFEKSDRKLTASPRFAALTAGLPASGTAFVYADTHCLPQGKDGFAGISVRFSGEESGCGVLRKECDGWLWLENSAMDWNEQKISLVLNLADLFGGNIVPQMLGLPGEAEENAEAGDEAEKQPADTLALCHSGKMSKIAAALERYAAAHQGAYPQGDGKTGWAELLRTKALTISDLRCAGAKNGTDVFVYFGGLKRQKDSKLPVVIDNNHGDDFIVLFADGTVSQFHLEHANTLPRIVSFLHTQYHWEERAFRTMMLKAAQAQQEKNR